MCSDKAGDGSFPLLRWDYFVRFRSRNFDGVSGLGKHLYLPEADSAGKKGLYSLIT